MLIFMVILSTVVLFVPSITAEKAFGSAWLVPITSSMAGFYCLWIIWKLGKRFPGKTLPQYSEIILGKILGKLLGGSYILFFLTVNILVIREFSEFIKIALLPDTPIIVINIAIVLVAGYAAVKGIEVITRMNQFVLPITIIGYLFFILFAIPKIDYKNLLPLLEGGVTPILAASMTPASWFGEIVVLVMLLPHVNKPEEIKKKGIIALLAVSIALASTTLVTLSVFGKHLTANLNFPLWSLLKTIEISTYIERVESMEVLIWITGVVIKVALFYYLTCFTSAQVFRLKGYNSILYIMGPVQVIGATYLFANIFELKEILVKYWPPFGLFFEIAIPSTLLAVAVLKKLGRAKR